MASLRLELKIRVHEARSREQSGREGGRVGRGDASFATVLERGEECCNGHSTETPHPLQTAVGSPHSAPQPSDTPLMSPKLSPKSRQPSRKLVPCPRSFASLRRASKRCLFYAILTWLRPTNSLARAATTLGWGEGLVPARSSCWIARVWRRPSRGPCSRHARA